MNAGVGLSRACMHQPDGLSSAARRGLGGLLAPGASARRLAGGSAHAGSLGPSPLLAPLAHPPSRLQPAASTATGPSMSAWPPGWRGCPPARQRTGRCWTPKLVRLCGQRGRVGQQAGAGQAERALEPCSHARAAAPGPQTGECAPSCSSESAASAHCARCWIAWRRRGAVSGSRRRRRRRRQWRGRKRRRVQPSRETSCDLVFQPFHACDKAFLANGWLATGEDVCSLASSARWRGSGLAGGGGQELSVVASACACCFISDPSGRAQVAMAPRAVRSKGKRASCESGGLAASQLHPDILHHVLATLPLHQRCAGGSGQAR